MIHNKTDKVRTDRLTNRKGERDLTFSKSFIVSEPVFCLSQIFKLVLACIDNEYLSGLFFRQIPKDMIFKSHRRIQFQSSIIFVHDGI